MGHKTIGVTDKINTIRQMKQGLLFCCWLLLLSCDDGDVQIEGINFDSATVQSCDALVTTATRIFFKINQDEALILNLPDNVLKNEVSIDTIRSAVPAESKITYRIFSGTVAKNYFCDAIPPSTPIVVDEIEAENGEVRVVTKLNEDGVTFEHKITLNGISLVTESGTRITDLRINDFGTVTTKE